jgi:hypothetical protein
MFDLEANKSIALRLVKVFNGRRLDLLEHVLHPEFRGRGILSLPAGRPRRSAKALRDVLSSDPRRAGRGARRCRGRRQVVLVDRFGGTHRGEFLGRPGTGDRIEWMAIHIYTIRDGKVLEDAKWPTPKPSMRIGE